LSGLTSDYEIILVNDGSTDNSWQMIENLADEHPEVCGINLMRNFGQHNALLCGIRQCNYEVIVTLDDDLQNPPEELPILLAKLEQGFDVVYGTTENLSHNPFRVLMSRLTRVFVKHTMGIPNALSISPFRAFRSYLRDSFANFNNPFVSIDVLLTWGTTKFAAVPVRHLKRQEGKSGYSLRHLTVQALNMLTGFSTLPLRLASLNGIVCIIFGISALAYVLVRYVVNGGSIPGFPFLACLIIIFSGSQLFALGVIGEYLARMYLRSIERPSYVIQSNKNCGLLPSHSNAGDARERLAT
jgi:undecaprenyl-phosphate 4-deoxy-4-formamido-L-arabinose transferase